MNYETTANPAGDDDTRPFGVASAEAGAEASAGASAAVGTGAPLAPMRSMGR